MSGHCLYLVYYCEAGHYWEISFEDRSGCTSIGERKIPDEHARILYAAGIGRAEPAEAEYP